jgi:hypothetical protein
MMPITPIGTRMRATSMPVGRFTRSEIAPTGSGSCATCSRPAAICSMSLSVSVRRSTKAASRPSFFACSTSSRLAASSAAHRTRISAAMAWSARFLAAVSARASTRAAARAAAPSPRI